MVQASPGELGRTDMLGVLVRPGAYTNSEADMEASLAASVSTAGAGAGAAKVISSTQQHNTSVAANRFILAWSRFTQESWFVQEQDQLCRHNVAQVNVSLRHRQDIFLGSDRRERGNICARGPFDLCVGHGDRACTCNLVPSLHSSTAFARACHG